MNANTRLTPGDMISVKPSTVRFIKPQRLPDREYEDVNGHLEFQDPDRNNDIRFRLPLYDFPQRLYPHLFGSLLLDCDRGP
jgi:hypothetical protein